ncbi:MAG: hypothetical protein GY715_04395 [Planctomycetes bacterium]|nr:hypothetical protein [Planctomycetota bacterium]
METAIFIAIIGGAVLLGLAVGLVVGAILLRFACWVCRVPPPGFFKAAGIAFLAGAGSFAAAFAMSVLIQILGTMITAPPVVFTVVSFAVSALLGMVVSSTIYKLLIPTSWGKATLIWLVLFFVNLLITAILFGSIRLMSLDPHW